MAGTVSIGCKIPNGIVMRLHQYVEQDVPLLGGGFQKQKIALPTGKEITLKGWARKMNEAPALLIDGYCAINSEVDADFWAQWLEQNKNAQYIKNGMIFAVSNDKSAIAKAREEVERRSGMEPLDPDKLPSGMKVA